MSQRKNGHKNVSLAHVMGVPRGQNVGAEVLVWADETTEDYTDKFQIDEHNFEGEG